MPSGSKGNKVAASCQLAFGPTPLETVSNTAPAQETTGNRDAVGCLRDAIDRSGVQDKVLVDATGVSKGYFSKTTNGASPCPLQLLDRLPDPPVLDALDRMARQRGARVVREDEDILAAQRLAEVANDFIRVRVRMAR